jgi:hypothetical protein
MEIILTILGIIGYFSLIAWFIRADNTLKNKEPSLQQKIDSLKKKN